MDTSGLVKFVGFALQTRTISQPRDPAVKNVGRDKNITVGSAIVLLAIIKSRGFVGNASLIKNMWVENAWANVVPMKDISEVNATVKSVIAA